MVNPPLTLITWPVMNDAAGEAKNSTGAATSSGARAGGTESLDQCGFEFLVLCLEQWGVGGSGADRVDGDPMSGHLAGE